jgi:hypothetical protein
LAEIYLVKPGPAPGHLFEDLLYRHGIAAALAHQEKLTIAVENAVFEADLMIVVIATKGDAELLETEPIALLRVALGLLDLPNHSVVHRVILSAAKGCGKKEHADVKARCVLANRWYSVWPLRPGSYGRISLLVKTAPVRQGAV